MYIKDETNHTIKVGDESEKNIFDPDTFSDYKKTLAFLLDNKRVMVKRPNGKHEVVSFDKIVPDTRRPGHQKIIAETGEIIDDDFVEFHSPLYHVKNILSRMPERFQDAFRGRISEVVDQWNNHYNELKSQHFPVCMPDPDYFMEIYAQSLKGNSFDQAMMSYAHSFLGAMEASVKTNQQTWAKYKGLSK